MGGPTSTRVTFEGYRMDARTRDMIIAARVRCTAPIVITQGCYNAGAVAASAGTHDGGGVVDIRAVGRTAAEREEIVKVMRWVGFAAWLRTPEQGNWPYHVHCAAIDCPDLAPSAARQVTAYENGRNGLANNGPDTFTRAYVNWTWEKYKKTYPDLLTEDELSAQDVTNIRNDIAGLKTYLQACTVQIQAHEDQGVSAKVSALMKQEADRYQVYYNNLRSILAAVAADDANDVTKADVDGILKAVTDAQTADVAATGAVGAKVDAVATAVAALPKAP